MTTVLPAAFGGFICSAAKAPRWLTLLRSQRWGTTCRGLVTLEEVSASPPPAQPRGTYGTVDAGDLGFFRSVVGERHVVRDAEELAPLNRDWMGRWTGASEV